jgi:hypothetical protein
MTWGAGVLLEKFGGSTLAIAEAFLKKELRSSDEGHVGEIVDRVTMMAAIWRVEKSGYLPPPYEPVTDSKVSETSA